MDTIRLVHQNQTCRSRSATVFCVESPSFDRIPAKIAGGTVALRGLGRLHLKGCRPDAFAIIADGLGSAPLSSVIVGWGLAKPQKNAFFMDVGQP